MSLHEDEDEALENGTGHARFIKKNMHNYFDEEMKRDALMKNDKICEKLTDKCDV